ncbi:hypothetical protein ACVWA3_14865, partial [Enterococcus faecalis]
LQLFAFLPCIFVSMFHVPLETLEDPFIDVEFSELTEEESKTIDAFINDYYSDGDLYENI